MKRLTFFAIILFAVSACGSSENKVETENGEIGSSVAAGGETEEELKAALEEVRKEDEAQEKSRTSMSFDKLKHDFGKIKVDTDNKATFVVTNTGDKPLIISDVAVSCGCTTAEKPSAPIPPGKSDKIAVVFHPKPGQLKEQKKSITVTANTMPEIVVLDIQAFVNE